MACPSPPAAPIPVRAVLLTGSRFLYVLNRASTAAGGSDCTTADPCQNSNITQFAVGGNGILAAAGDLLHPGHQSLPPDRRLLGQLPLRARPRCPGQQCLYRHEPRHQHLRQALGANTTSCGDITAFSDQPDHRTPVSGRQCPGDGGQRHCRCPTSRFRPIRSISPCPPATCSP